MPSTRFQLIAMTLPIIFSVNAAFPSQVVGPPSTPSSGSNLELVEKAFADWQMSLGSFYDLLTDEASVTIEGQSPRSGVFDKATFIRDRAKPFQARFSTPIVPTNWSIWAVDDQVIVRWGSRATACDGKPYSNSYAYFITMTNGRATALTMFLDMGAFDDVWNRCRPSGQGLESPR